MVQNWLVRFLDYQSQHRDIKMFICEEPPFELFNLDIELFALILYGPFCIGTHTNFQSIDQGHIFITLLWLQNLWSIVVHFNLCRNDEMGLISRMTLGTKT